MADILNDIVVSDKNVACITTLNGKKIYGVYSPMITVETFIKGIFDNYSVKNCDIDNMNIYSVQLNKLLNEVNKDMTMSSLGFTKISNFDIKSFYDYTSNIAVDKAYAKYNDNKNKNIDYDGQIFVKTLTGSTYVVPIESFSSTTIADICTIIAEKHGIPVDQQRLVYTGDQLELSKSVNEYKIQKESTLHLILRLRGGMFDETSGRAGNYQKLDSNIFFIE